MKKERNRGRKTKKKEKRETSLKGIEKYQKCVCERECERERE